MGVIAARTCLLPPMKYDEDKAIGKPRKNCKTSAKRIQAHQIINKVVSDSHFDDSKYSLTSKKDSKDVAAHKNIDVGFDCNGGLLTISFHIRSADKMKAYLYFNGQMIRFLPRETIQRVLPKLFNMEYYYGSNTTYMEQCSSRWKKLIDVMEDKFVDKEFRTWQHRCTCNT